MATVDDLVERINLLEGQVHAMGQDRERVLHAIHELNDLLAAMKGHGQLTQMEPTPERSRELAEVVLTGVGRAQDRIRVLLRDFGGADAEEGEVLDPSQFRVLVTDDEELIRTLLVDLMAKRGYEVASAASGEEAIGACRVKGFDLIFMDFRLGDMTGVVALREIRKYLPEVRVVFLTGDPAIEEIRSTVLREGADGFITKPFDVREIEQAVQHLFQSGAA